MRRHPFPMIALAALALMSACSDMLDPDGSHRSMGVLQQSFSSGATATGDPAGPIRWNPPLDAGFAVPPEVITAPDTVAATAMFVAIAHTIGTNGCWRPDGLDIRVTGRVIELTPWDLHSGADVCTTALGYLPHAASLSLDQTGEWTLRVRGRRVRGDGGPDGTVTAERTIVVRPAG